MDKLIFGKISSSPESGTKISYHEDQSQDGSEMSSIYEPPKKKRVRARLDHLSPGEKLQRRKMKNRIAAQTARDRKRAKIDHLEEENRKLREENDRLKSKLKMTSTNSNAASKSSSSVKMVDSGVSDIESIPKISISSTSMADSTEMDLLTVPQQSNNSPSSPGSSSSGAYSASPVPDNNEYLDSLIGETDEELLMNDILQLQDSIFGEHGDETSIGSAELISAPQQQVQEALYQSPLVENSAGWTSIQLMLLLMISRVHHRYSWKTKCCATNHECNVNGGGGQNFSNLYDYILQTRCIDFQRAAGAIISSNKNDVRKQRLVALEFVYIYLYNSGLYRSLTTRLRPK